MAPGWGGGAEEDTVEGREDEGRQRVGGEMIEMQAEEEDAQWREEVMGRGVNLQSRQVSFTNTRSVKVFKQTDHMHSSPETGTGTVFKIIVNYHSKQLCHFLREH